MSEDVEVRNRINVGWLTSDYDTFSEMDCKIVDFTAQLGEQSYNFIAYPIGGVVRAQWKYKSDQSPPVINLPDIQLKNHLWETYVSGTVSPWIDCDSPNQRLSELSQTELLKELHYVCYLGLRTIIIPLKRTSSPKLAALVNKWLWTKQTNFSIWMSLPTSISLLEQCNDSVPDVWSVWADFRQKCVNPGFTKLQVALQVTSELDDEFSEKKLACRWLAESVAAFIVNTDVFTSDSHGSPKLPGTHTVLLQTLWLSDSIRLLVNQVDVIPPSALELKRKYAWCLRNAVRDTMSIRKNLAFEIDGQLAHSDIKYHDVIQAPLQPLSDDLDSGVYNTFEMDTIKYTKYQEAVFRALRDFGETAARPLAVTLYVLGAGRGPLVTASFEAEKRYNDLYRSKRDRLKIKMYVVEKNPNSMCTLRFMNDRLWHQRATLVESDMRSLPEVSQRLGLAQPDIIVSELLGSFGDNELSPECIDGVTSFLKPTTISIPQSYVNYVAPVMSLVVHQSIKSMSPGFYNRGLPGHGRLEPRQQDDGSYIQDYPQTEPVARLDEIYVVHLERFCPLATPQKLFSFEHPNFEKKSNERNETVVFDIDRHADLMGFVGYFSMKLYADVELSTHPDWHTPQMASWFPAVVPLRHLHRVAPGDSVGLAMKRRVDSQGVWYEWNIEHKKPSGEVESSEVQNKDGQSYYMRM